MDLFIEDLEKSFHGAYSTEDLNLNDQIILSDVVDLFMKKKITKL
jgi:hypothetical protein